MNLKRTVLLIVFLFSLCFISACRTTESQLRSLPPELLEQAKYINQTAKIPATPQPAAPRIYWFLLTAAVLAGAVMVFVSDRADKKKPAPKRRSSNSKKRKK